MVRVGSFVPALPLVVVGALTAVASPAPAAATTTPGPGRAFCDVAADAFYADAVAWAKSTGITSGVSPTEFDPHGVTPRGQLVTLLHRWVTWRDGAAPPSGAASQFTDVAPGAYYAHAVGWAAAAGVTTGVSPTRFDPTGPTTRAQLATFIHRLEPRPEAGGPPEFDDVPPGSWFAEPVTWMAGAGLTTGTGPRTFSPHAVSTRAQVVTFLWRLAGAPEPGPVEAAPCPRTFTAIGDSVMRGAFIEPAFPGWVGDIDARGCRQALETVADTVCGVGDIHSTLAVLTDRTAAGTLGEVVLIHAGTNGPLTATTIDRLVEAAPTAQTIWFITVRSPWSNQVVENETIAERAAAWRGTRDVRVLDWYGLVAADPGLVGSDGIHLSTRGRVAFTDMIGDALRAS